MTTNQTTTKSKNWLYGAILSAGLLLLAAGSLFGAFMLSSAQSNAAIRDGAVNWAWGPGYMALFFISVIIAAFGVIAAINTYFVYTGSARRLRLKNIFPEERGA